MAELERALGDHGGEVLVVGKSLATFAAPFVADRGWDAVWLTPLLHRPGADHGLQVGGAVRSAEVHLDVTRRITAWLRRPGGEGVSGRRPPGTA